MTLRRVGKPVKIGSVLYAVIVVDEAQALFPHKDSAQQWAAQNYKGRSDATVEAVRFDEQNGAG